ncbi:chemotaxis protein CheW [Desulfococcaceae bacterium HSG8]|nr:chemotaxis protein CheW [Desulfococcaceae bacterium HSG8]
MIESNQIQNTDRKTAPLEELIAEIDAETGGGPGIAQPVSDALQPAYRQEQYIRFFLEDILLAIPMSGTLEIGHRPKITWLPNLPDWVLGISNIRGEIVSIVDLKAFFGMPSHGLKRSQRFIIVHDHDMKVGLVVDKIMGIFFPNRIDKNTVRSSPYEEEVGIASYISGVVVPGENHEEELLNILDTEKLLASPRMTAFRSE